MLLHPPLSTIIACTDRDAYVFLNPTSQPRTITLDTRLSVFQVSYYSVTACSPSVVLVVMLLGCIEKISNDKIDVKPIPTP